MYKTDHERRHLHSGVSRRCAPGPPSKFWGSSCCYGALADKIRAKGTCTPAKASAISASPAEIVSGVEVPVISTSVPVSATLNRK